MIVRIYTGQDGQTHFASAMIAGAVAEGRAAEPGRVSPRGNLVPRPSCA